MFSIVPPDKKLKYKSIRLFIFFELLTFSLCILLGLYLAKDNADSTLVLELIVLLTPISMIIVDYLYRKMTSK